MLLFYLELRCDYMLFLRFNNVTTIPSLDSQDEGGQVFRSYDEFQHVSPGLLPKDQLVPVFEAKNAGRDSGAF